MFNNCYTYNQPGIDIWFMCDNVKAVYDHKMQNIPVEVFHRTYTLQKFGFKERGEDRRVAALHCKLV